MAIAPTPLFRTKSRAQQTVELRIGEPIESVLHRLYVVEQLTQDVIAERLRIERSTVSRWMREFGIPTEGQQRSGARRRLTK